MAEENLDVDHIIEQLLSVRGARPGRQVNLTENEIKWLCIKSREIFIQQPVLLELEAPIKICGNTMFSFLFRIFCSDNLLQVIYTVSITICYGCSSTADSPLQQIIYFSGIV